MRGRDDGARAADIFGVGEVGPVIHHRRKPFVERGLTLRQTGTMVEVQDDRTGTFSARAAAKAANGRSPAYAIERGLIWTITGARSASAARYAACSISRLKMLNAGTA